MYKFIACLWWLTICACFIVAFDYIRYHNYKLAFAFIMLALNCGDKAESAWRKY
jgi:hypothetical protein